MIKIGGAKNVNLEENINLTKIGWKFINIAEIG